MKPVEYTSVLKTLTVALLVGAIGVGVAHAGADWTISRDDTVDSPLFKQRPMLAWFDLRSSIVT